MNTQDYLIQARDALNQALVQARTDMEDIRRAINGRDQDLKTTISELRNREKNNLSGGADTDSDRVKAVRQQEAAFLKNEEAALEQDYKRQRKELDNILTLKQRGIDDMTQIVNNLDMQITQASSIPSLTL